MLNALDFMFVMCLQMFLVVKMIRTPILCDNNDTFASGKGGQSDLSSNAKSL